MPTPLGTPASGDSNGASVTQLIISHTLAAGSNRAVYAGMNNNDAAGELSVTYNGVAMTEIVDSSPASQFQHLAVFAIDEDQLPAAGTYDIVFNWTTSSDTCPACVVAFSDVDSTTPYDGFTNNNANSATPSVTVSSATGDLAVSFLSYRSDATPIAPNGGETEIVDHFDSDGFAGIAVSYEAGAASVAMDWLLNASAPHHIVGLNLNAAAAGGGAVVGRPFTLHQGSGLYLPIKEF
jgi:hypothetical protein